MDNKLFKETFDVLLKEYVDQKTDQAKQLLQNPKLNSFIDYIQTFLFSGGKRIRPYCLWAMYKGFGGTQDKDILQFGIIFELLHTMALIHDDIIDQSEKRHNVSTMHTFISSIIGAKNAHVAEGQAILIGDLLLSWVYELGYKHHEFSEELLHQARQNVHLMIEEVILGQMIDVDMMTEAVAPLEMIEKKNMYKTASYTFIRPMLTGAILANADESIKQQVIELGKNLGLAFQLRDDLMDLTFGDATKSPFSDIQEGQQTYFTNYVMTKGTSEDQQFLASCMGRRLSNDEIQSLQSLFEKSGAIAAGKELIAQYALKSKEIINQIQFKDSDSIQGFIGLVEKIAKI